MSSVPWSFRDPVGSVLTLDGRVFRVIREPHRQAVLSFIDSVFFRRRCAEGDFPATEVVQYPPAGLNDVVMGYHPECILEHHRIPFPVYPHEWPPSMLYEAGKMTLDLADEALADGWMLKDASPWNVLYSDGRPVFCDILSFEPKTASAIWNAYAQFQRTFVLPLYAHDRHAWPVHAQFLDQRDGLNPSALAPVIRGWRRWAPFELQTIILPTLLSRRASMQQGRMTSEISTMSETSNQQRVDFVLRRSFRRLRKQLNAVRPCNTRTSPWINYENDHHHYNDGDHELKSAFVRAALSRVGAGRVLDIGANAGEYSVINKSTKHVLVRC